MKRVHIRDFGGYSRRRYKTARKCFIHLQTKWPDPRERFIIDFLKIWDYNSC